MARKGTARAWAAGSTGSQATRLGGDEREEVSVGLVFSRRLVFFAHPARTLALAQHTRALRHSLRTTHITTHTNSTLPPHISHQKRLTAS